MSFKLVIFDCDGVMFDSRRSNEAFYNHIKTHFGLPELTPEEADYVHMATTFESVNFIIPEGRMRENAQAYRKTMSYRPFLKLLELEPDLYEVLDDLRPEYKLAVCTNRSDTVKPLLAEFNLEKYFDTIVSCLDVKNPKPDPEGVRLILHRLDVIPGEALYIGDSETDLFAAKGAGVPLAAFRNKRLDADYHIERLRQVRSILNGGAQ